jgi:short-subunit dehydrogenase
MPNSVLITGCSSGIGRKTAQQFATAGWEVYATARDRSDIRDLEREGCHIAALDVTDPDSIDAVTERIFDEQGHLDCLVNNAGYGQFGPVEDVPVEKAKAQFEVNTFGPLALIHAVLPKMRARKKGTIINVGAGVGGLTVPGLGVYTASKFALQSLTDALRQEVSSTHVDVVYLEPGIVATPFYDRALAELDAIEHTPAYDDLYSVLDDTSVVQNGGPGINQPMQVARVVLKTALKEDPKPVVRVGATANSGSVVGGLVRGRLRNLLSKTAIRGLSNERVQKYLEKRRPTAVRRS